MFRTFPHCFLCLSCLVCLTVRSGAGEEPPREQAVLLEVHLPITGKTSLPLIRILEGLATEMKSGGAAKEQKQVDAENPAVATRPPTLILRFHVGADQDRFGRGSRFGACYELADFLSGETFAGIRTVAFLPQSVRGHALLIALACDERIVAESAQIGEAGCDEAAITATMRQGYLEIAARRGKFPPAVVEKLLDPNVELLRVDTEKGTFWGTPDDMEKRRATETFAAEPEVVLGAGQPGLFSGAEARHNRLADFLAKDTVDLARGLGLRPDEIRPAPLIGRHGHAVRIDLVGPVTATKTGEIMRQIKAALDGDRTLVRQHSPGDGRPVDFICLVIDSAGGALEESLNLATFISKDIDPRRVRTVAYVPSEARCDAALIALACDEVVLAPKAILGGDGAVEFSQERLDLARPTIVDVLAKDTVRGWSIPLGIVDPRPEIFKATRKGARPVVDYFCAEELAAQPDADQWTKGDIIKPAGVRFETNGEKGSAMQLVDRTAGDFAAFKMLYGLENDPMLLEPGWADYLVRALASPGMAMLLLFLGIMGLWAELKTPGIGIGALLAVVCFALFFWSHFLGGTVGWLEIILFVMGVVFLLVEVFVLPGFGLFGVIGGLSIVASVVLASQTFIIPRNSYQLARMQTSLVILVLAGIGVLILGAIGARRLHEMNKNKDASRIAESEKLADYAHLLGAVGIATTLLVPAGKARFGDDLYSVVSDGDVIDSGAHVEVVEVQGYKIVVRAVSE